MRTTIEIDDGLMHQAMKASGLPTKGKVVEAALRLLVACENETRVRRLRGSITWMADLTEMRRGRASEP